MYIRDMNYTKGHVSAITEGHFHPKDPQLFMTSSLDSTIRLWDAEAKPMGVEQHLTQAQIIKVHRIGMGGKKIEATSCCYSPDGALIGGGARDGSLQVWDTKSHFVKPVFSNYHAHLPGHEVTCVLFFQNSSRLLSRSCDGTLKIWDIRNISKPQFFWEDLENFHPKTNVTLSPDEKYILTGTSAREKQGLGFLHFYDSTTFQSVASLAIAQSSVVRTKWHPEINQLE